jgi:hypothetical protein
MWRAFSFSFVFLFPPSPSHHPARAVCRIPTEPLQNALADTPNPGRILCIAYGGRRRTLIGERPDYG